MRIAHRLSQGRRKRAGGAERPEYLSAPGRLLSYRDGSNEYASTTGANDVIGRVMWYS